MSKLSVFGLRYIKKEGIIKARVHAGTRINEERKKGKERKEGRKKKMAEERNEEMKEGRME